MKNSVSIYLACVLTICVCTFTHAQTDTKKKSKAQTQSIGDVEMNKKLAKDIVTRFPLSKSTPITWENSSKGYIATYAYDNEEYMTRYDRTGSYQGTFVRRDWDTQVPSNTRNFYNASPYSTLKVGSYWEVTDGARRGSYIVASNEQGAPTFLFIDEQGQFSENPFDN